MEMVNRILQEKITARIAPNKVVLIFGARRVGKTVMMRQIVNSYSGKTLMLNGEDYDTLAMLENRSIANYRHLFEGIDLLAIDEAQNIPQVGNVFKLIVDEMPNISVLASGSSSFDLFNKTGEPLVGRFTQFVLTPFSQKEIAQTETALETHQNLEARLTGADGQQAHAWFFDAEDGIVNEMLGLRFGVGASIDKDEVAALARDNRCERRALDSVECAQFQRARRDEDLGVARADDRPGFSGFNQIDGAKHGGIALALDGLHDLVLGGDDLRGVGDREQGMPVEIGTAQQWLQHSLVAHQIDRV